ncbi:bacteriocin immunity protein [Pseudomonas sp. Irchel 3F3]|uniref:bacteriocin immunity protein n=1 Tax=Pseudomonas sp. Irchel 3F3 TaxID=2009000 RepID=UPI00117B5441|nr:bacteriocin immunity protein [Pseudomonas sp. Irchel 3F3]
MVIRLKHCLADYSYDEFRLIVEALIQATGSRAWQDRLLEHFIEVVEHPDGADLIYYPEEDRGRCAEQVMARVLEWRASRVLQCSELKLTSLPGLDAAQRLSEEPLPAAVHGTGSAGVRG